jgi:MATE family multidrug resistance protein
MTEIVTDKSPDAQPAESPLRELLSLAAPTVAQMASYTLMQFIDTWILAQAGGVTAPTAAANAGMLAFSAISLGMGVMFVVNALVSQSFGRKSFDECGRYLWQGIWFAAGFSLLLIPVSAGGPALFRWLKHDSVLIAPESVYLRIVLDAAFLKLAATAVEQFLLGINRPTAVAIATVTGVAVNAVAAWIIVLGRLGVSPHGVAGAAVAQNIGVGTELLLIVIAAFLPGIRRTFNLLDWKPRLAEMWVLLKLGIPSGIQILSEVLAWSAFTMWVMAVFHTEAMAANVFVFRYMSVSFMPAFGISVAVTALVGRSIGQGRPDLAVARANLGFKVTCVYMVTCGILLFTFRRQLIGLFTTDPKVLATGATLLIFAAVYQLFDAVYIIYNGALRGAGDTLVPALFTGIMCWSITVFGSRWVATTWPQMGPIGPWISASCYGMILGTFILLRFKRGRWKRIELSVASGPLSVVKGNDGGHPFKPQLTTDN